jgi:hypothetical protein
LRYDKAEKREGDSKAMAKQRKRRRSSSQFGPVTETIVVGLVVIFILSGGASIVNHFIDGLGFHGLPSGSNNVTDLVLGALGIAVGLAILVWRRFARNPSTRWAAEVLGIRTVEDIYALSPGQFEQFVAFLFQQRGFAARVVGHTGDEGVDIELQLRNGQGPVRMVAQCKRYRGSVGQPIVREFYGSFANQAAEGFLVTTGTFTQPARDWAASRPVKLIDGAELLQWTEQVAQHLHHHPSVPLHERVSMRKLTPHT